MEKALNELTVILESEVGIHNELLATASAINKTITGDDILVLQQHTTHYDDQIYELEQLEEKRKTCCSLIVKELGLGNHPVKITTIIEHSPSPVKSKIAQIQKELKDKVMELSRVNVSNRILLEESLGMIENTFTIIRKSTTRETGYKHKGTRAYSTQSSTFINQVA